MNNLIPRIDEPKNEPVYSYAPGSPERESLKNAIKALSNEVVEIGHYINGKRIYKGVKKDINAPHDHSHKLGTYFEGDKDIVKEAIDAALKAEVEWRSLPWDERLAIFMRAAELLSGPYRYKINAATMLGQSKNVYQAEIDAACELVDFLRFNCYYAKKIYEQQPASSKGVWNRMDYRPLEGFIWALTPFNFTSISGNLPTAPAIMGNVVVWKPSTYQIYSAGVIIEVLEKAGLPPGVINMVLVSGSTASDVILSHPHFAGFHFTGSTEVFTSIWKKIASNLDNFRNFPRIVGETGGKDFIVAHPSADIDALVTAITRAAFEYQGQKCSAASRAYIPASIWKITKEKIIEDIKSIKIGPPQDFSNFMNAVISQDAFKKIVSYIEYARKEGKEIIGGEYSNKEGYFIKATVIVTDDPYFKTMCEEIFGPVISIYVYEDSKYEEILDVVNNTSPYGLTGSIFAEDRKAIHVALNKLMYAAGNFYINDKPTGAIVNEQPFGGSRLSGTNDKSGFHLNLLRWVSPRSVKENFFPPKDYRYPFMMS